MSKKCSGMKKLLKVIENCVNSLENQTKITKKLKKSKN